MLTAAAQESLTYRLCHHNKDTQQKHHFGLTDGIEGIVMDLFRQKTFSLDSYIGWVGYACQRRGVGAPFRCGWALRKQSAHMNNKQVARCFCFNISSSSSGWLLLLLWIFISFFFFSSIYLRVGFGWNALHSGGIIRKWCQLETTTIALCHTAINYADTHTNWQMTEIHPFNAG